MRPSCRRARSDRRRIRWLACLSLVAFLLALGAAPASAHLTVSLVGPEDGERLDKLPATLALTFSEPVSPADLTVELRREAAGVDHELTTEEPGGRPAFTSVHEVPTGLPDDSYTVTVTASGADGHVVRAQFAFVVGAGALVRGGALVSDAPRPPVTVVAETAAAVLRNIGAVAAGAFFVALWCWPRLLLALRGPVLLGLVLGAVSTVLGMVVFTATSVSASVSGALDLEVLTASLGGQHGRLQVLRLVALVVLASVLASVNGRRAVPTSLRPVAVGSGIVLLLTLAATSHAAGQERTLVPLLLSMVHVGSTALWAGGLVTVWVTRRGSLLRLTSGEEQRFSGVATPCVLLAVASGAGLALDLTNGFDQSVVSPAFGAVLGVKLVLVFVLLAVAAHTRAEVRRAGTSPERDEAPARAVSRTTRAPTATLREPAVLVAPLARDVQRLVTVEMRVGTMVFALAALLTVVPS